MRALAAAALLLGIGSGVPACASYATQADAVTRGYLQQARQAVRAHDVAGATAALDAAENAWLIANQARANPVVHHEYPALRDIGGARSAVRTQNWDDADYYIGAALRYPGMLGAT